jgi:hypothetical protein
MKTHFMFNNIFPKIAPFINNVKKYGKDWAATNDVTIWRLSVTCLINKVTCTYAHAHAKAPGYPQPRTHACTHRPVSNACYFSTVTIIRERALMLRYTYIAPLGSKVDLVGNQSVRELFEQCRTLIISLFRTAKYICGSYYFINSFWINFTVMF